MVIKGSTALACISPLTDREITRPYGAIQVAEE